MSQPRQALQSLVKRSLISHCDPTRYQAQRTRQIHPSNLGEEDLEDPEPPHNVHLPLLQLDLTRIPRDTPYWSNIHEYKNTMSIGKSSECKLEIRKHSSIMIMLKSIARQRSPHNESLLGPMRALNHGLVSSVLNSLRFSICPPPVHHTNPRFQSESTGE